MINQLKQLGQLLQLPPVIDDIGGIVNLISGTDTWAGALPTLANTAPNNAVSAGTKTLYKATGSVLTIARNVEGGTYTHFPFNCVVGKSYAVTVDLADIITDETGDFPAIANVRVYDDATAIKTFNISSAGTMEYTFTAAGVPHSVAIRGISTMQTFLNVVGLSVFETDAP